MLNVVSALEQKEDNRNGVGQKQESNGTDNKRVVTSRGGHVKAAADGDPGAGHGMSVKWDTERGVDLGPEMRARETVVTREGPAETGHPGLARDGATPCGKQEHGD